MLKWVLILLAVGIVFVLYCCLVAASRADEAEERMLHGKDKLP